jgi:hypothetical protein
MGERDCQRSISGYLSESSILKILSFPDENRRATALASRIPALVPLIIGRREDPLAS